MQIVQGRSNLHGDLLSPLLRNSEISLLHIREKIASREAFHHYIDKVLVLKNIKQPNNMWMLAHFENLDFSSLQLHILHGHVFLGHDFDSNFLTSLFVNGSFDKTKLAFSEGVFDFVKVK